MDYSRLVPPGTPPHPTFQTSRSTSYGTESAAHSALHHQHTGSYAPPPPPPSSSPPYVQQPRRLADTITKSEVQMEMLGPIDEAATYHMPSPSMSYDQQNYDRALAIREEQSGRLREEMAERAAQVARLRSWGVQARQQEVAARSAKRWAGGPPKPAHPVDVNEYTPRPSLLGHRNVTDLAVPDLYQRREEHAAVRSLRRARSATAVARIRGAATAGRRDAEAPPLQTKAREGQRNLGPYSESARWFQGTASPMSPPKSIAHGTYSPSPGPGAYSIPSAFGP